MFNFLPFGKPEPQPLMLPTAMATVTLAIETGTGIAAYTGQIMNEDDQWITMMSVDGTGATTVVVINIDHIALIEYHAP